MTTQYENIIPPAGILIFAPHPDDDVLSSAVVIQRALAAKAPVHVVFLTSGESNPWPQRYIEKRWIIKKSDSQRWAATRADEARAALASLGVNEKNIEFLQWPDLGITNVLLSGSPEPVQRLLNIVQNVNPGAIIVPALSDLHPDHSAAGVLFELVRAQLKENSSRSANWFWYLVHKPKIVECPADIETSATIEERQTKRAAIACHKTQTTLSAGRFLAFSEVPESFFAGSAPRKAPFAVSRAGGFLHLDLNEPAWAKFFERRVFLRNDTGDVKRMAFGRGMPIPKEIHCDGNLARSERLFLKYEFRPIFRDFSGWIEL